MKAIEKHNANSGSGWQRKHSCPTKIPGFYHHVIAS